jgi:spore germination cell wall hydrolase CwlJ-like protein
MSLELREVDGALPRGADHPVFRPAGEMIVGLQAALAGLLALTLAVSPETSAVIQAPVAAAAQAVRPLIPPEGLAGPTAAQAGGAGSRALVQALLKQAHMRPTLDPRSLSWDQARRLNAVLPSKPEAIEPAQPFHLQIDTPNGKQALSCLTQAVYYEAGASGPAAEAAVAQVVLNRVRHPAFPKSVCGVVYEGSQLQTGCQFTFTCDGALQRGRDPAAWEESRKVALRALGGRVVAAVGTATYYHADYVFPAWATTLVKMATVGPHIFYREPGEEGEAAGLTGTYAGGELRLTKTILRATDRLTQPHGVVQVVAKAGTVQALDRAGHADPVPAGFRIQADRLQRVHQLIAAAPSKPEPPKMETASVRAPAVAPVPAPSASAIAPDVPVQTSGAQAPAA